MNSGIWQLLSAFIGIILVIFLAYFLTRWYAKKFGATFGAGRNIKVIDKLPVGKASSIAIIQVSDTQYMVGITENNISLLKELEECIPLEEKNTATPEISGFLKTLKDAATAQNKKSEVTTSEGEGKNEDEI